MKKAIILILLVLSFSDCYCQDIKSLVIQVRQHNEPPTIPGPATYEIEFISNKSGDLYSDFYRLKGNKNKKVKLKDPLRIPKEDIELFLEWRETDKSIFSLNELEVNIEELNNSKRTAPFKPEITILDEFEINIDTLIFCSKYQNKSSISTGGYVINVFLRQLKKKLIT
jgi:hypothetical protein